MLKEHKRNIRGIVPLLLIGGFFAIMVVMVLSVRAKNPSFNNTASSAVLVEDIDETDGTLLQGKTQILAVIKKVDFNVAEMTLLDTNNGQDITLNYTGGTNVLDKYEKVIAVAQLTVGEMVDVYYDLKTLKIAKVQISNLAWEYKGVTNWSMDDVSIDIINSKYRYSKDVVITRQGVYLNIADLDLKDELILKGYGREIWSILVTKGHGTLRFTEYEDFIGGIAYIGNKDIIPIYDDMIITAQEGSYDITFEKGSLTGRKSIQVLPGEEVIVSMEEFKKPPVQTGTVKFIINPEGADLYIDNTLTEYEEELELEYGEHSIKVSLGGYTTYTGVLELEEVNKTVTINLAETKNEEDSEATSGEDQENGDEALTEEGVSQNLEDENDSTNSQDTDPYQQVNAKNYIYLDNPQGASAYFNGQFKGTVPVSFPKEAGTHYITLIQSGYATKTYTVEVKEDEEDVKLSFPDMTKSE